MKQLFQRTLQEGSMFEHRVTTRNFASSTSNNSGGHNMAGVIALGKYVHQYTWEKVCPKILNKGYAHSTDIAVDVFINTTTSTIAYFDYIHLIQPNI